MISPAQAAGRSRSAPPLNVRRWAAPGTYARVRWEPLPAHLYDQMPERGMQVQQAFYRNLRTTLSGLPVQKGRAVVVVPARNEERDIADTLDHLRTGTSGDANIELVIVVNASTDGTESSVRRWAASHRKDVELVDHIRGPKSAAHGDAASGRVRLHLMEEPTPGKTGALLQVDRLFEERGAYPEWIAQLDADTRIHPGDVSKLIGLVKARGQIAATGSVTKVRRDREPLIIPTQGPPGTFESQGLRGHFLVSRTQPWVAGYRTILEEYPQAATEDTLLTAMFRTAGFKTGSRSEGSEVPYETLGPSTEVSARKQLTRWMAGSIQLERLYGTSLVEGMGLRPNGIDETVNLARTAARYSVGGARYAADIRNRPRDLRLGFSLARHPVKTTMDGLERTATAATFARIALEAYQDAPRAADEADRRGRYSWVPGR